MNKIIEIEDYKLGWDCGILICLSCGKRATHVYYKDYTRLQCTCFFNKFRLFFGLKTHRRNK